MTIDQSLGLHGTLPYIAVKANTITRLRQTKIKSNIANSGKETFGYHITMTDDDNVLDPK